MFPDLQTFHMFLYDVNKVLDAQWKIPWIFLNAGLNIIPAPNCGFFLLFKF